MRTDNKPLEIRTISFRGNKQVWMDFVYVLRKRGERNVWSVLKKMIGKYLEEDK